MHLNQQQIEEARTVYDLFWDSYQKGDVGSFATTLDDHFEMIGTSETERCHSKAEGIEFFKSQTEEVVGKAEMRNRQIHAISVEGMVLVNELCDIYVLAETDWNFYSIIRISTFLKETSDGWKVVQQHGSFPDMRVQEGETLAIDKISRENVELRDAVKRRTAELENKNRELEIEAALERVRARSMAMQHSDELNDVLSVLFDQFYRLGIEPVNVFLSLFSREDKTLTYRATGTGGSRTQGQQVVSLDSMEVWQELFEKWKNDNSDSVEVIYYEKEILPTLFGLLDETFSAMPEEERMTIDQFPEGGYTAHGYTPFGYIGFNHTREPTSEEKVILTKFASEFSRVYQRFLDIEKAEAQTRESEIQLALERVRARSMAMRNSDELSDVLSLLFQQFDILGINPLFAHLSLFDEENDTFILRMTGFEGQRVLTKQVIDINEMEVWLDAYNQWKEEEENAVSCIDYPYEVLPNMFEIMQPIFDALPEGSEMRIEDFPDGLYTTQANCKFGYLGFNHRRRATEEEKEVVVRFAKEFGRLYQRFLELQQAEAQGRESEIQLALERVRARTMAMHNSRELAETSAVLFEQMKMLGVTPERMNICLVEEDSKELKVWSTDQDGVEINHHFTASFDEPTTGKKVYEAWKKGLKSGAITLKGDDLLEWIKYVREEMNMDIKGERIKDQRIHSFASFSQGLLITTTSEPLPLESMRLMERFAEVFNLTYTRFLDLQKAEEQAREAKIEAALERVRSKSLAMHESSDLHEVVTLVYQQLETIGLFMNSVLLHELVYDSKEQHFWVAANGQVYPEQTVIPLTRNAFFTRFEKARKSDESFFMQSLSKRQKDSFFDHYFKQSNHSDVPQERKDYIYSCKGLNRSTAIHKYTAMSISRYDNTPYSEEENKVIRRFAQVFEQSYQRYLDLKKAEEQTREAEIEASLERVRSKGLAMHSTDDIKSATAIVFNELSRLGIGMERCGITIMNDTPKAELWSTTLSDETKEVIDIVTGFLDFRIHPLTQQSYRDWNEGKEFSTYHLVGNELQKYYNKLEQQPEYRFPKIDSYPEQQVLHSFFFSEGAIFVYTIEELSAQDKKIIRRFTSVFEQTYTRFLDLQKAEKQAREAQIEAALERIRSKAIAMQNTDDIAETVITFFEELLSLGLDKTMRAGIGILSQEERMKFWTASAPDDSDIILHNGFLDMKEHPLLEGAKKAWADGEAYFNYILEGEDVSNYFQTLNGAPDFPAEFDLQKLPDTVHHRSYVFKDGLLYIFTEDGLPDDISKTLERFAAVFGQTYTRYLDLEKAEIQAREARIETALERVRSRSMAMQSSKDLRSVVDTLYGEFESLDVDFHVAAIQLMKDDSKDVHLWLSTADGMYKDIVHWPFTDIPIFYKIHEAWTGNKILEHRMNEAETREFFDEYYKLDAAPQGRKAVTNTVKTVDFTGSYQEHTGIFLMRYTEGNFSEIEKEIVRRFSKAFEQTYTRFIDLQKAEKLAFESARQASLDRIRAEIASMRSAEDLQQITPIIWDELKNMGIPFIRCGVFIIDDENDLSHTYLSTAQGDPIAALHLPLEGIPLIKNLKNSWDKGEIYTIHWNEDDFREWTQNLIKKGFIDSKEKYEAGSAPKKLDLHFLPFKHGMLYIGNIEPLSSENLDLGQSMAKALSVAYDRYEDFNKLEQAKTKVENALSSLESAQKQLVQQEKLASLGQLTAGIAHEIKNPLNFINNFSDLSVDLVNEIREELRSASAGNELRQEDIQDILNDLETNLKTIYKHGSRTDTIVKSMLEHSRGGSGVMEPNNVNELLTEFGNLSYHGMRAGKEPMQVEMVYELDDTIEDIPIVAEDFSRVIVNLCYNSFDAMRSKENDMKEKGEEFDPKLILRTRLRDNNISIEIEDNGSGIPAEIKDKILQPFFTTKKGTAGTGLGLSITNEIISAHGGSLQIDSEKDTFTRFSIVLPKT